MASYDPPQPLWKRCLAGVLDFVLAIIVVGSLLSAVSGDTLFSFAANSEGTELDIFPLERWPALGWLAPVLIIAYFVVLGRTGGTVFQRLFRMKRAGA
jgi:RDD family